MLSNIAVGSDIHTLWMDGAMPRSVEECLYTLVVQHPGSKIHLWMSYMSRELSKKALLRLEGRINSLLDREPFSYALKEPVAGIILERVESISNANCISKFAAYSELSDYAKQLIQYVLKLGILYDKGGLYVDPDIYVVKPIPQLLKALLDREYLAPCYKCGDVKDLIAHYESQLIYAQQGNQVLQAIIKVFNDLSQEAFDKIIESYEIDNRQSISDILTSAYRLYGKQYPNMCIYPIAQDFFNSLTKDQVNRALLACGTFNPYSIELKVPEIAQSGNVIHGLKLYWDIVPDHTRVIVKLDTSQVAKQDLKSGATKSSNDTESHILEQMSKHIKVASATYCGSLTYSDEQIETAKTYLPITVAICDWIAKVAECYDTSNVLLCYRDAHLVDFIMGHVDIYKHLNLLPVWMNRDIAGSVAGFEGPGYQFEPDYCAYNVRNPYQNSHHASCSRSNVDDIRQAYFANSRFRDMLCSKKPILVFDLSTCHYSAQETFSTLFPGKKFIGCYLFTFTRSTNDSYRLRTDYKAWGHITVSPDNSKNMRELESFLSWSGKVEGPGFVDAQSFPVASISPEHTLIIKAARDWYSSSGYEPITIATGLKALPYKFEV